MLKVKGNRSNKVDYFLLSNFINNVLCVSPILALSITEIRYFMTEKGVRI